MNRSARTIALALSAPALVFLAACGKGSGNENAPADTAAAVTPPPPSAPATAAAPAVTDPQIAAIVVAANSVDSTAGVMAQEKGTDPRVKQFGQTMVADHGGVNREAVALVTRLHVTPEANPTSQQLTQGGEQSRQQLSGLTGASFDRGYIDHEVEYHQTVLTAIDSTLIPSAQNADLKALLVKVRPAVAAHLQMAQDIQKSLQGGQ